MYFFKFNIGDYASHTRHLSPIEDIAYRRMLDLAYTTEKPIPKDIRELSRLINLRKHQQEITDVLNEFWEQVEEGWINNRVLKEIEATGQKSESASRSAKARWDKMKDAKAMREESERNANALKMDANASEIDATRDTLPETHYPLPETLHPQPKTYVSPAKPKQQKAPLDEELQAACRSTWSEYSRAYQARYGVEPIRNKKINSQVKSFVGRIGYAESPMVAAFYVMTNSSYYVTRGHGWDSLLSDAEKLRTEWATGTCITSTRAKQLDQSQANAGVVNEALKILEGMDNAENS